MSSWSHCQDPRIHWSALTTGLQRGMQKTSSKQERAAIKKKKVWSMNRQESQQRAHWEPPCCHTDIHAACHTLAAAHWLSRLHLFACLTHSVYQQMPAAWEGHKFRALHKTTSSTCWHILCTLCGALEGKKTEQSHTTYEFLPILGQSCSQGREFLQHSPYISPNLKVVSLRRPENLAKQTCFPLTEFRKININAVASKKQKQTIDAYLTNVEKSASRRQCLAGHGRRPDVDPQAQRDRDRARSLMSSSSLRAAARKAISASGIAFAFFLPCLESASPLLAASLGFARDEIRGTFERTRFSWKSE